MGILSPGPLLLEDTKFRATLLNKIRIWGGGAHKPEYAATQRTGKGTTYKGADRQVRGIKGTGSS